MKLIPLSVTMLLASGLLLADDGALQSKDVSKTPDWDTEHASLQQLWFYVPAQQSDFTLVGDSDDFPGIEYCVATDPADPDNCTLLATRYQARPLVAFYEDGPVDMPADAGGFYGHGERDMYGALSLDDGATWRRTNLSKSADKSSIKIKLDGRKKIAYPGDVFRNFTTASGNKVLAVWASRYCGGGNPNYALDSDYIDILTVGGDTPFMDLFGSQTTDCTGVRPDDPTEDAPDETLENCLYFGDAWGVAGSQGVKDFAEEGYETVGQVPYACMWAARGTLEPVNEDGVYDPEGIYQTIIWRTAERLTSGRRDAHRMEASCVGGAGCVITWQEDPDGLRPGDGEGPGEGWSGAVAHHETDIWYSYIDWDGFDLVLNADAYTDATVDDIVTLVDYDYELGNSPKVGIPFSIPVRLTDNAMCVTSIDGVPADEETPYCHLSFDDNDTADFCIESRDYTTDPPDAAGEGQTLGMCIAEDGRLMRGNTASTRARTNLRGYDSDGDGVTDSAWVIMAYEESKGLGDEAEEDIDDNDKIDMGKNIWYHTFEMFAPELVSQGMMLNQPAIYPDDVAWVTEFESDAEIPVALELDDASMFTDYVPSENASECDSAACFARIVPDPIYSQVDLFPTLYQTEIARRYSQITQPASMIGPSRTVALAMYKQGIIRRGGPADVFARRFVLPEDCSTSAVEGCYDPAASNPYDYANMVCDHDGDGTSDWLFTDGLNPRYVKGLCMATPINLSATTVAECYETDADGNSTTGNETDLCMAPAFPFDDHFADIIGGDTDEDVDKTVPRVSYWRQCESDGLDSTVYDGTNDGVTDWYACADTDINDQAWENPFDVAKGHRGFMYGDFIMAMYAWSPNWKDNAEGKDNYNLYVRRSFTGGTSWTTLPADDSGFLPYIATMPEGLVTGESKHCEWYQPETSDITASSGEDPVCYEYAAGEFEQARNLSQLTGRQATVLDPRYAPTDPSFLGDILPVVEDANGVLTEGDPLYPDDVVDPSVFFATYEEGDISGIIDGGEAVPMDMFYARAYNFGDQYEVGETLPEDADVGDADGDGSYADIIPVFTDVWEFEIFDKLECSEAHAAEAALKASPGGTFFYAIWQQWKETDTGHVYDADATVRRTMELNGDEPEFATDSPLVVPEVTYPSFGCGDDGGDDDDDGGGGGNGKPKKPKKPKS